jgi:hypothetical protein
MKKTLVLLMLCVAGTVLAQNTLNAPWMQQLQLEKNGTEPTYQEIVAAGNAYFDTIDKNAKGSGYKPFMRWVETAKQFVKDDGMLQTNADLTAILAGNLVPKGVNTDDSNWFPSGPYGVVGTGSWSTGQGRVNAIAVDPSNPNTYYIGAPGGGVFKSIDAGATWTPLTDFISRVGASAIAIDPNNSNIIYIGTGDDDGGDAPSIGMLKSTDGGATFNTTGLTFFGSNAKITEIYLNPTNANELYIATNQGFYKSTNAGANTTLTFNGNVKDIKLKPNDPNTIYLTANGGFFTSTNAGNSFTVVSTGLPTNAGRMVIAVTPANAQYVYVLAINASADLLGVYRSTNGGSSFIKRDSGTDILENRQGFYDLAMEVSTTDPDKIWTGCLNIWQSLNGGSSFTKVNSWSSPSQASYTHADIHQIRAFGNTLFVASDGGIYRATINSNVYTDLTADAQIGQFYRIAVSKQSSNDMMGGLQDNGGQTFSNNQWKNFYGADGMDAAIDPNNANVRYGFIQNGGGLYITNNAGNSLQGSINGPETGNWITPLQVNSQGTIYAGYSMLYKVVGNAFVPVSTAFPGNIDVLKIDPTNDNIIYAADGSQLYRSIDAGVTFTPIASFNRGITAIEVNANDNATVYVATSFSTGSVLRSTNSGISFTNITGNLPALSKNTLAFLPLSADNALFVGTSVGVYRYTDALAQWERFGNNLPNVTIRDLEINVQDQTITAATYGRGIWQSALNSVAPSDDLQLLSLQTSSGALACGDTTINVVVKNTGVNSITNVIMVYDIDGASPVTQNVAVTIAPGAQSVIPIYNLPLLSGDRIVNVNTTIANDAFVSNNRDSIRILKNESSAVNDVYGFENRGLLATNENGGAAVWQRGIPTGTLLNQAPAGANVYATNLAGAYPNNTISYLYSGCYDLSAASNPILEFDMGYDLELNWDIMYMQYSLDSGATWLLLGDAASPNWYNSSRLPNSANCYNCIGAQWTGADTVLKKYTVALASLNNPGTVVFRFVLHTDESVTKEGAVIDNFVITGTLSSRSAGIDNLLQVYPNPSTGLFTLVWTGEQQFDYIVYDLSGKEIIRTNRVDHARHKLDLSRAAKGMYFLKIITKEGTTTKKLIVQ